jgi:hypothetical protein
VFLRVFASAEVMQRLDIEPPSLIFNVRTGGVNSFLREIDSTFFRICAHPRPLRWAGARRRRSRGAEPAAAYASGMLGQLQNRPLVHLLAEIL